MHDISALREKALKELEKIDTPEALEAWRVSYLGRKSALSASFTSLAEKPLEEKKILGSHLNNLKKEFKTAYEEKQKELKTNHNQRITDIDLTMPGIPPATGRLHLLTQVEQDIKRIFTSLHFSHIEGPELETEWYNFDALNIPKNHPTRDMQDTLWVKSDKGFLMRTQTSPVQIRYMQKHLPPFQIISIGRVFRHEATDTSHEINFYQCEGLMVGPDINLAHFKYIITEFFKQFFDFSTSSGQRKTVETRFRPSYFPFVEPGLEVDIRIQNADSGYQTNNTKNQKSDIRSPNADWLEIMGAGMVHPRVFEAVHYDPKKVRGFAFGMGLDRIAMIKYGIPDIRLLYSGDLRFSNQF